MTGCQRRLVSPSSSNLPLCHGSILDFQLPRSGLLARDDFRHSCAGIPAYKLLRLGLERKTDAHIVKNKTNEWSVWNRDGASKAGVSGIREAAGTC